MKKSKFLLSVALLGAIIIGSGPARSQPVIEIMSGSVGKDGQPSTYLKMVREMGDQCSDVPGFPKFQEVPTAGSNASFAALLENQVPLIAGQGDVAHWLKRTQNLTSVRLIAPLHREAVHYVVKADAKVGSWFSGAAFWDKSDKTLRTVEQLNGGKVGVINGSGAYTTARLVRDAGALPYSVETFEDEAKMRAALDKGEVNAVVYVGGAPLASIAALPRGQYRLLSVGPESVKKMSEAYEPINVDYASLGAGGSAATVATRAGLFAWNYKGAKWQGIFSAIQTCLRDRLEDIKETPKTHKAWRDVVLEKNIWERWEAPAGMVPAATVAPAAPAPVAPAKGKKAP